MLCETKIIIKKNMGLIIICNNPLNPEFQISFAKFSLKSNLKTLSTPLLKGEIFENNTFKTAGLFHYILGNTVT